MLDNLSLSSPLPHDFDTLPPFLSDEDLREDEIDPEEEEEELEDNQHEQDHDDDPIIAASPDILPIDAHRDAILSLVDSNRVVVLHAETGSGKSTRLPQFLHRQNPDVFIVLTQPRRIAAISLAKRVAHELGEQHVGKTVGYAIRDEVLLGPKCRILFATTGWLLRKILFNREFFTRCTHLIIDEVHERSLDGDLLFLVVRQLLREHLQQVAPENASSSKKTNTTPPKIIAMSATLDSTLLCDYFASVQDHPVPSLFVGAHRFPTARRYLDDLLLDDALASMSASERKQLRDLSGDLGASLRAGAAPPTDFEAHYQLATSLIAALTKQLDPKDPAAILVFLPGMTWIDDLYGNLTRHFMMNTQSNQSNPSKNDANSSTSTSNVDIETPSPLSPHLPVEIFAIHSTTEREDQQAVFTPILPGRCRIVLATNIAESSITIPFVRYVLDFGLHRQVEYDPVSGQQILITRWISQSNCAQRAGRTGRTCPGTYYLLMPRLAFDRLDRFAVPEMLRVSLSSTLLSLKLLAHEAASQGGTMSTAISVLSNARQALKLAMQPPDDATLDLTIQELFRYGVVRLPEDSPLSAALQPTDELVPQEMLDAALQCASVTSFGKLAHALPFGFDVCRLVLLGARSGRFVAHALIMAIAISQGHDFFVRPYPYTSDLARYYQMLETTQLGRQALDRRDLSDSILALRLYLQVRESGVNALIPHAVHLPRVKIFLRSIREMAHKIAPLFPSHQAWLHCLVSDQHLFNPTDALLFSALRLDPADVDYLRFMLAAVFIPTNGLISGMPPAASPSHPIDPVVTMLVPDAAIPSLRAQLQDTFSAIGPLLANLQVSKKSARLPQSMVHKFMDSLSRKKNQARAKKHDEKSDADPPPSLSGQYATVLMQFAGLDPIPDLAYPGGFYPLSLPLRVFCQAFQTRNALPYMRFPRLPEALSSEDVLATLFGIPAAPSPVASSNTSEHLFFSPSQKDLPKPEKYLCKYKLDSQQCSVDTNSLFSFLHQSDLSATSTLQLPSSSSSSKRKKGAADSTPPPPPVGRPVYAVAAQVQVVMLGGAAQVSHRKSASGSKPKLLYVPAHLTLLNQSPSLFTLILLTMATRQSPLRSATVHGKVLSQVKLQQQTIDLPKPVKARFFDEPAWIAHSQHFEEDALFAEEAAFSIIPDLSPESVLHLTDLLGSYTPFEPSVCQIDHPDTLCKIDREAVCLAVTHLCSARRDRPLEIAAIPHLLSTYFAITHPLCTQPQTLIPLLRNFSALTISANEKTVAVHSEKLEQSLAWRLPRQPLKLVTLLSASPSSSTTPVSSPFKSSKQRTPISMTKERRSPFQKSTPPPQKPFTSPAQKKFTPQSSSSSQKKSKQQPLSPIHSSSPSTSSPSPFSRYSKAGRSTNPHLMEKKDAHQKSPRPKPACYFGDDCYRVDCQFTHPADTKTPSKTPKSPMYQKRFEPRQQKKHQKEKQQQSSSPHHFSPSHSESKNRRYRSQRPDDDHAFFSFARSTHQVDLTQDFNPFAKKQHQKVCRNSACFDSRCPYLHLNR